MLRNTRISWGALSRVFHWSLGLVIIGMLAYGWWMNHIAATPDRFFYRSIHADIGYVVLLLMIARLIWRSVNLMPAPPANSPAWEQLAARVSHAALYGVTILVATLGWAHAGAHKPDYADWFGLFRVPQFTSTNKESADFFEHWHIYMAYVLIALVAIHILAALYHHFIKRDDVMSLMITGTSGRSRCR